MAPLLAFPESEKVSLNFAPLLAFPGSERSHLEGGAEAGDLQLAPELALVAAHAVHHAGDVAELLL